MTRVLSRCEPRPTAPATGGRSASKVPWPRRLLARRRDASARTNPFFPRIEVDLVGLDPLVWQRRAIQPGLGVVLGPMPRAQQGQPVAVQLARQPRRRDALGEAAEDQDELGGATRGPLQGGAGEDVEGAAAMPALVIEHRGAAPAVDAEAVGPTAAVTGQPLGMEQVRELGVAGVLVEQVGQGEVHRCGPGRDGGVQPP